MNTRITSGRWYSRADVRERAKVAVLGPTLAKSTGKAIGDRIAVRTANGPVTLRVIGVSANQANNSDTIYTPTTTLQSVLGSPAR